MKDVPENELLSAYLDGELTAAEQAELEQWLAATPAAHQLLEELRAVRSKLQALPQHKLGEDLSEPVLRIAEQRILTEPAPPGSLRGPSAGTSSLPSDGKAGAAPRRLLRRLLNPRAVVWSSLAVAVAVVLMVTNQDERERPAGGPVARGPEAPDRDGRGPSIRALAEPGEEEARHRSPKAGPAPTAEKQAKGLGGARLAGRRAMAKKPSEETGDSEPIDLGTPPAGAPDAEAPSSAQAPPGGPPDPAEERAYGYAAKAEGQGAGRATTAGRRPGVGKGGDQYKGKAAAGPRARVARRSHAHRPPPGLADGDRAGRSLALAQLSTGCAVVCCDVSPTAARRQTFDSVLVANGITVEKPATRASGAAGAAGYDGPARGPQQQQPQPQPQKRDTSDFGLAEASAAGQVDLVYVEATPAQVRATLDDLKTRPGAFITLSVQPALGVEAQKGWAGHYDRRMPQKARRGGQAVAEPVDDAAAIAVPVQPGDRAEQRPDLKREDKAAAVSEAVAGRAWRLRVPGPTVLGGQRYWRFADLGQTGLSGVMQQTEPDVPTTPAEPAPSAPEAPAEPPEAPERPVQRAVPADEASKAAQDRQPVGPAPELEPAPRPAPEGEQSRARQRKPAAETSPPAKPAPQSESRPVHQLERRREGLNRLRQPVPKYRVLFVLRMAGAETPTAPTAEASTAELAEPAEPAEPPAAEAAPAAEQ